MYNRVVIKPYKILLGAALVLIAACGATLNNGDGIGSSSAPETKTQPAQRVSAPAYSTGGLILHDQRSPDTVRRAISSLSQLETIGYLYGLDRSTSTIIEPSLDTRTVLYAIFGDVPTGSKIKTRWTVSRATMSSDYSEEYVYTVRSNDSKNPYIVLNSLYNENPGEFTFELFLNDVKIASSSRTYKKGLN